MEKEEVDEIDIPIDPDQEVEASAIRKEEKLSVRSYCPLGLPDGSPGSHADHDAKIRELVAMIQNQTSRVSNDRTTRMLAERVKKLERGIKIILQWLPRERQLEIEHKLQVKR